MTAGWGAVPLAPDRTRFRIWAPGRDAVALEMDGDDARAMTRSDDGWFETEAPVGAGARYRFRIDAETAIPDPASRRQADDVHGWSVVVDPAAHAWRATGWRGRPWEEAVIHESHVGAAGGFVAAMETLPDLAALGFTAVQLMPVNAFSGTRNWGYDGVLPYAPANAYGTPEDLKALVDRAHGLGLMVFLDVVYNHFGPDGNYLHAVAPDFFDEDKATPWGGAVAVSRPPVADFFIGNARMWIEEYRFDGLRFDAVHAIRDPDFLDRMAIAIRAGAGAGRHVHLVLENEDNDADRLRDDGYDAQWNDDFHNVLHVLLTGETDAYYQDFADDPAGRLARCLREGFIYQGDPSPNHDGEPRGKPSAHLPPTRFVSFLQNHDQVGNRALGERLTVLVAPARLRAATALLLLSPQIPLCFMGDETGSTTPFLFFTDFHDALADAVRDGRRKEFAKFAAFKSENARERIPDPNARETFEASRPRPGEDAGDWRTLYRDLLTIRRERIVPGLRGASAIGAEAIADGAVRAQWRLGDQTLLTLAINLGDAPVAVDVPDGAETLVVVGTAPGAGAVPPASFVAWRSAA